MVHNVITIEMISTLSTFHIDRNGRVTCEHSAPHSLAYLVIENDYSVS